MTKRKEAKHTVAEPSDEEIVGALTGLVCLPDDLESDFTRRLLWLSKHIGFGPDGNVLTFWKSYDYEYRDGQRYVRFHR